MLKISSFIVSKWATECNERALGSLQGFWGLVSHSMALCCCSTIANNLVISWLWAFISSGCWRCIWDNMDTRSWCAFLLPRYQPTAVLAIAAEQPDDLALLVHWALLLGCSSHELFAPTWPEYSGCSYPDCPPDCLMIVTGVDCLLP